LWHNPSLAEQPATKFRATINRCIREIIPRDPNNAAELRQSKTLGGQSPLVQGEVPRALPPFLSLFKQRKSNRLCLVNDENTLRKAGSKTDPYNVFRTMLDAGNPPGTMAELLPVSAKSGTRGSSPQQAVSKPRKKPNR
jgi:toxin YhaV